MRIKSVARPMTAAVVAMSMSAGAFAQDAAAELPSAESLFNKCFEAMNASAMENIQSASWTVEAPEMMGAEKVTGKAMSPDKCRIDATVGGGDAFIVFNGKYIWSQEPGGDEVTTGDNDEINGILVMMAPQFFLHTAPDRFKSKTTGTQEVGEENSYRVVLHHGEEETGLALLFGEKSGLLTAIEMPNPMGEASLYEIRKWETVEGLKVITEGVMDFSEMGMGEMVFGFTDFKFNGVDESVFAVPAEVKSEIDGGVATASEGDGG